MLALSVNDWLTIAASVGGFLTIAIPVGIKLYKVVKTKGIAEAAKQVPQILIENREAIGKIYRQLKAVVKAVDLKEAAISDLIEKLPEDVLSGDLGKTLKTMSLGTVTSLSSLDLAKIPFKDIVNAKLMAEGETNDELLKSLVDSARKDEATNIAIDRVASIIGGVAGEGLNIGTKIATGGTVSVSDIVGFLSGVGSSALGARDSSKT